MIKFGVVLPVFEFANWFEDALDHPDNLVAGDVTGVGDVIGSEGSPSFPKVEAGIDEISAMRDGIDVVVNFGIALQLAEVVARIVYLVKGNAKTPDVAVADTGDCFLCQAFGTAVETARRIAEGKIRLISFGIALNRGGVFFGQIAQTGFRE